MTSQNKKTISNSELAMNWWNELASARKTQICDTNTELVGNVRRWETLTESEIEIIYNSEIIKGLKFNIH